MLRHSPPVAMATGQTRSRTTLRRVHAGPRGALRDVDDIVSPGDLGLGELFVHPREAVVVGNVETGQISLWNPAAEQLFGWAAAEAIGQPIEILIPQPIVRLHQQGLDFF